MSSNSRVVPTTVPTPTTSTLSSSAAKPSSSNPVLVTTRAITTNKVRTVLDSGASRHLEVLKSLLRHIHPCTPVTLQGISGKPVTIAQEGSVGNCHHVLFAPSASASVRSVSGLIDSHNVHVLFASDTAFMVPALVIPPGSIPIADRREDGLFHMRSDAVPPPPATGTSATVFLSVSQQIKREQVHRLHRMLGHASPRRMAEVLKRCPQLASSLSPKDIRLFTSCDACALGDIKLFPAPPKSDTRSFIIAYRMHADTSGPVRPGTASGFRKALIVVDDASRWYFVALLRRADMLSISRALRAILRDAANGESVLRTKILRSDNGTDFKNALVDKLLAEGDIQREFTCVGTSHQNAVAERATGVLFAMARTMLADSSLPPQFWGEALMTEAHIHNRMP